VGFLAGRSRADVPLQRHWAEFTNILGAKHPLVSNFNTPSTLGIELLLTAKQQRPDLLVFMVAAYGDKDTTATAPEQCVGKVMTNPADSSAEAELNCVIAKAHVNL
jgi:DNA-binding NtrC family response regulator